MPYFPAMADDFLTRYRAKRDFTKTREPSGERAPKRARKGLRYLIQRHDATRLHHDFRLELNGVLLSWAVTRGPSLDPHDKRLAVHVEDHPLEYGDFEGTIPAGNYGAGTVMLWDEGTWEPVGDPVEGMAKGDFKFVLHGERLKGKWVLVRIKNRRDKRSKAENWLLIKERDEYVVTDDIPVTEKYLTSVRTGRTMDEIAAGDLEWVKSGAHSKSTGRKADPKKATAKVREATRRSAGLPLPKFVAPQLATLTDAPPAGDNWVHEIKYDGYRALAAIAGGDVRINTRTGLDWTDRFRPLVPALSQLPVDSALLDGEIAVADKKGRTDFGALQHALAELHGRGIVYYVFDVLELDGKDLRREPLVERKEKLAAILKGKKAPLIYSDHVVGHGAEMFRQASDLGLEGIISKRADAPYRSERTKNWLKVKTGMGQEFTVIGWQPSTVQGRPFSSLLVAVREDGRLVYRGRVGSGYGENELETVWKELKKREVKEPLADDVPADIRRKARFVKPDLVAEIAFRGWGADGMVRQGSFKGLRMDKPAREVVKEEPAMPVNKASAGADIITIARDPRDSAATEIGGVRVTHPNKIIFPDTKVTKRKLIEYYLSVADWIMPHVANRPLSLVRAPDGAGGETFFQKHASQGFPAEFRQVMIKETSKSEPYLYIEDEKGLIAAVQMGVLELHIWGSHIETLEKPDRVVFDFDPDEGMGFGEVVRAARDMRERLDDLGLESVPMVSGGKGIHVVVPLKPSYEWPDVKAFTEALARAMAADEPDRFLAVASKAKRQGRIFIDYLRNGRGATAIAPFSSRARSGAPLAWPVSWSELGKLDNAHPVNVENAAAAIKKLARKDPWEGYFRIKQELPLKKLRGR
jgi:bifunctional non-homologous end joining protein LigD